MNGFRISLNRAAPANVANGQSLRNELKDTGVTITALFGGTSAALHGPSFFYPSFNAVHPMQSAAASLITSVQFRCQEQAA